MAKSKLTTRKETPPKTKRMPASKGGSLAEQVYEQLKEKIITLHFLPGQYLNEGALCAMLGAGRTPVHQALQRLELERLVEIMPRKGVIVQPDSIAEILKILDSRVTVEAELARNAAQQRTAEDTEVLKMLARRGYGNGQPADVDTFITGDRAFHEQFAKMAGNVVLSEFARSLHERSIRYWYLHLWQTMDTRATIRQHSAIADMIAKGDGEAAAKAVRDHIESLRERLIKAQSATRRAPPPPR
ncbi:MAG: GntR family transcriptional regulator [Xanthobacteraceae bacterium]|nr:GntR family transcriptional regulator [Xanthobacteraceae bacterium]MBV9234263.1 GntR family transcriptional regulator [Xanthobacteraceae bacterium]MBV9629471.1 GntR family transcriptional regulator [Xanthobacteraceae bacterium]